MLKLSTKPTYKREIKVDIPGDMGRTERAKFIMEFKRLSVSETKEFVADSQSGNFSDEEMVRRYAVDWEGVEDSDGKEMHFTRDNLDAVMDVPYIRKAIVTSFLEDVFGAEAIRKN